MRNGLNLKLDKEASKCYNDTQLFDVERIAGEKNNDSPERTGPTMYQHHPHPGHGCRPEGQLGPSRDAHGGRAHGLRPLDALPQAQPRQPPLAQPGPVCPLGRTWLHAPLQLVASDRLRSAPGRVTKFPPMGQPHRRSPGARPDTRRRDHHRPPGTGLRQWSGHGHRRALPG